MYAFWRLVFAFIWTFILGWLCDKGYKSISWFLVMLPYIIMFLATLNIYHVTHEQRQLMRTFKLQGAYGQEAMSMPTSMPSNLSSKLQSNMSTTSTMPTIPKKK
jgi:hypothetical protein